MSRLAPMRPPVAPAWWGNALALLSYCVGSLFATWPLAAHLTTHVPGDGGDDPALAWNLWWIKARLIDHLQPDIFHGGWMFHPIDINLAFYTLTPFNGLLSVPLQTATTLTLASNLILLSSFALSGFGVFLLTRLVWARHWARIDERVAWAICWLAGAFFAFAGAKLFYASLGQFNIASSHWLPFCVLYVWRTWQSKHARSAWRNGAWAGAFLLLQAWAELTFATFLLIFFALAYLFFSVQASVAHGRATSGRGSEGAQWWHATQGMIIAALIFAIGLSPFLAAMLPDMRVEGDFFTSGGGFADTFSADLMGYLVPTRLHPWLGAWVAQLPFPNSLAQHIYLGYVLMLVVAIGLFTGLRQPRERTTTLFWGSAFVLFWLLTLGPFVRWAGQNLPIPGPFSLVSQLPFFNGNRYPSRYSVMLLLCAAILAARGLLWLTQRPWARRQAWLPLVVVGALFAAEHISTPLPLNDFRIPPIYQRIAAEAGDFAVLELPTGWRNGARIVGKLDPVIMMQQWYQTEHGKRRLGGNTSRNPAYKFQYFSETPTIATLIALMNSDRSHLAGPMHDSYPDLAERVAQDAPALFDLFGIRYVTLHVEKSPPLLQQLVEDALPVTLVEEWQGTDWTGAPSTIRLYAVDAIAAPSTLTIDLANADANMYLAEGWSPVGTPSVGRFATRPRVNLLLPNPSDGATLTLTYAEPTRVSYALSGRALGQKGGDVHTLTLPAQSQPQPTARLTLTFADAPTPIAARIPNPTPIGRTGTSLAAGVTILAQSAGEEVGDFAHLWVNGVDYASGEIGYNLVAMTTAGEILGRATFDTMRAGETGRMAAWLNQWELGIVIIGAAADSVADEDPNAWDERVIVALQRLGVVGDLRGKLRWSHAFVGVVGAPSSSAPEDVQWFRTANVVVGLPLNTSQAYGPLQSVTVER